MTVIVDVMDESHTFTVWWRMLNGAVSCMRFKLITSGDCWVIWQGSGLSDFPYTKRTSFPLYQDAVKQLGYELALLSIGTTT